VAGLGVVADGDAVPPAGGVPDESRWPHALSRDDKTSADAQTTDVIRMAKLPNGVRASCAVAHGVPTP